MNILILGGTAFLGPATVKAALARGHNLTLFNRGKTNPHLFPDVEKLVGDRDGNLDALVGREWDAVVDTSGFVPRIVNDSASLLADHVGQYVYISSISVYARFDEVGIDEDFELATMEDPTDEEVMANYGALKALCEQAAETALPGRTCNIRPGLIVGPMDKTDRFTYWPVRVSRGGEVLAPGDGTTKIQVMDVDALGEWIVYCIEQNITGAYNATSPPGWLNMGSLLETCKRVSGSDATFTWADAAFLEQKEVGPWMNMPCWMPAEGEYAGFGQVSVQRAVDNGLSFPPITETVRNTLDWWSTVPEERQEGDLRAGLSAQRETEVLEAWHAEHGS